MDEHLSCFLVSLRMMLFQTHLYTKIHISVRREHHCIIEANFSRVYQVLWRLNQYTLPRSVIKVSLVCPHQHLEFVSHPKPDVVHILHTDSCEACNSRAYRMGKEFASAKVRGVFMSTEEGPCQFSLMLSALGSSSCTFSMDLHDLYFSCKRNCMLCGLWDQFLTLSRNPFQVHPL